MSLPKRIPIFSHRLPQVDALRGIAALAVVFFHTFYAPTDGRLSWDFFLFYPFQFGFSGVHLFIVLSGFCIHRSAAFEPMWKISWRGFWVRRFWRLYPTYLAAIILSLVIYYSLGSQHYRSWEQIQSLPDDLLVHLLLIHNLFAKYKESLGNAPFWTLGLEEQLYLLYPLTLILRRWVGITKMAGFVFFITFIFCLFSHYFQFKETNLGSWPFAYWFPWVLGSLAADAHANKLKLPKWCADVVIGTIFVFIGCLTSDKFLTRVIFSNWFTSNASLMEWRSYMTFLGEIFSNLFLAGGFFIILNFSIQFKSKTTKTSLNSRVLSLIGLMSYSLYLTHLPILHVLEALTMFNRDGSLPHNLFRLVIFIPLTLLFAGIFYYLIERRFVTSYRVCPSHRI